MINKNYKERIQALDKYRSNEVILNDSEHDARDLFEQLIGNAQININILSEKLELYNTTVISNLLKEVTKKGVEVKILLDGEQKEISKDNKFLVECMNNPKCEVRISANQIDSHIITRDGVAYRYCSKSGSHKAIASFNGIDVVNNADTQIFHTDTYKNYPEYSHK